jgi:hypothetical protein
VISAYCAVYATDGRVMSELFTRHITGPIQLGRPFVTAALRRRRSYTVAGKGFPHAGIDEHDLRAVLQPEFGP